MEKQDVRKTLGVFSLAMINVAAVLSIRNFPSMAIYGWTCIGWYILGTILFLIPMSMTSAELATGWPEGGGVYAWVKRAFGEKAGFIAIFCEWSGNLVWFPTALSFIASTLFFAITPDLASNHLYMFGVMMIAFWGTTLVAYFGEKASTRFSNGGVILGGIIPAVILIFFAIVWIASGRAIELPSFSVAEIRIIPQINLSTLPFFATVVLMFEGMEMAGFHAQETRNPQKDYPRATLFSAALIFLLTVIGTLAVAFVIPEQELNLTSGVMQAIEYFLDAANVSWLVKPMAVLVTIGGVVLLAAWLIGPAKGLGVVAEEGNMPPLFHRVNKYGAPVPVLIMQAAIGSIVSLLYIFIPSVNQAYWILSAITVELICIVYVLVFLAVIKLRYSSPDTPRAFKIPGGLHGVWLVGGLGAFGVIFTFIIGILPPDLEIQHTWAYIFTVLFGTFILTVPPLIFLKMKKPEWRQQQKPAGSKP